MASRVAGWFLRAAMLGFLVLTLERCWTLRHNIHPWSMTDRQRDWLFAWSIFGALLFWCASRSWFNRRENGERNTFDRFVFGPATWLVIGTTMIGLACWLFLPRLIP